MPAPSRHFACCPWLRLPAALYGLAVRARNLAFDRGWLPQEQFRTPVISVGNLAVGGTGKTPHTELLIRLLQPHARVAVLSRGYRRRTRGYREATPADTAATLGDEPYQMYHKFPELTVAVCADRREGIRRLEAGVKPDVIVLDDAFQHRYVKPGLSLLLTTYDRPYTADCLLPAGRLREPATSSRRADAVVVTKCPTALSATDCARLRQQLRLQPGQHLYFTTYRYGAPYPLLTALRSGEWAAPPALLVVAGIAHPQGLLHHAATLAPRTRALTFADHHAFSQTDVERLWRLWRSLPPGALILTTEKDAARLRALSVPPALNGLLDAIWVQPIEVCFVGQDGSDPHFQQFILDYVTRNSPNPAIH